MEETNNEKSISDAEKNGLAKKKAINKAASYFSDDNSLFEFEGFEIEPIPEKTEIPPELKKITNTEHFEKTSSHEEMQTESIEGFADDNPENINSANEVITENTKYREESQNGTKSECSDAVHIQESRDSTEESNQKSEITTCEISNGNSEPEKDTESTECENTEKEEHEYTGKSEPGYVFSDAPPIDNHRNKNLYFEQFEENNIQDPIIPESEPLNAEGQISFDVPELYDTNDADNENESVGVRGQIKFDGTEPKIVPVNIKRSESGITSSDQYQSEVFGSNGQKYSQETSEYEKKPEYSEEIPYSSEYNENNDGETVSNILNGGDPQEPNPDLSAGTKDDMPEKIDEISETDNISLSENEKEISNDIWDNEGKEDWEKREQFLKYCRSLTLPPIKSGKFGTSETDNVKAKAKPASSGYRYAESERIPVFSDGLHGGIDKSGYAEREKRYCDNRKEKRQIALREKTRSSYRIMIYTAFILFTVFLLEVLYSVFLKKTVLFASVEIGLIILGTAFVWKSLLDGLKCALRGAFIPELLAFFSILLSLIYNFLIIFTTFSNQTVALIGIPGAISIFFTALYRYLMLQREEKVFDVTAEYGDYCTEVRMASFKGSPEEISFGGYADENSSLYKTNHVSRIDGGYNILPVRDECFGLIKIFIICLICIAIASGIAFGFINNNIYQGIFSAYILISFASPLCIFISLGLPRHMTAEAVAEEGAAITDFDDESDEFDENVIMISESELFPPEKIIVTDTFLTNSHFLETHLAKAAAAFGKIGGILSGLFSNIDTDPNKYRNAVITDISNNGISVKVDDSVVRAGDDAYLEKHGIEIERYPDIPQKNTRVLYIANNGEFFARIVIQYNPDEKLCRKISELRQSNTLFSFKTCNPCIDAPLVFYTTGLEPELLRVVKYMVEDDIPETDTDREGMLVSKTGAYGLLCALIGYKRQKKLIRFGCKFAAFSGLIGVFLALIISLFGVEWKYVALAIMGFHAVTSGIAAFISIYGIKHGRKNKRRL